MNSIRVNFNRADHVYSCICHFQNATGFDEFIFGVLGSTHFYRFQYFCCFFHSQISYFRNTEFVLQTFEQFFYTWLPSTEGKTEVKKKHLLHIALAMVYWEMSN